jgi:PAS domain S-box-containing protein
MRTFDSDVANALFERAAELAFNSVMVTRAEDDDTSPIVFVNDAFTEMTGYTADEVLGETPGFLQGAETDEQVLQRLDAKMKRGEDFHGETVNYKKDGTAFIIEWKVSPVKNAAGEITHYVSVQRDVTALREADVPADA